MGEVRHLDKAVLSERPADQAPIDVAYWIAGTLRENLGDKERYQLQLQRKHPAMTAGPLSIWEQASVPGGAAYQAMASLRFIERMVAALGRGSGDRSGGRRHQ